MIGGALAAVAGPLAIAQSASAKTVVEGVNLKKTRAGLSLTLKTSGDKPQVVTARSGETLQADIARAQLDLAQGDRFVQKNPAEGIESVTLEPVGADKVRLTVEGDSKAPISKIEKASKAGVKLSLDMRANAQAMPSELPSTIETVPGELEDESPMVVEPFKLAQRNEDVPEILIPNPEVIIDGAPVSAPTLNEAPPFLPRAVAPPVGDLSVSDIDATLDVIDLGTAERVPRLVLRDASAREVLSLLARAAGLNLAFTNAQEEGEAEDVRVSLDIENEPVQNVFNYVLQLSGLEANKVGRTIFVGPQLPNSARNVLVRSVRLNQVDVGVALNFLVAMGAETAVSRDRIVTSVNAVEVGSGTDVTETQSTTESRVENQRAEFEDANPLLRGLQVIGDERTNSLTLVGTPRQIEIASSQLIQLDLRRRQVAINLRVVDVNLDALDAFGTSFSFRSGDASFLQTGGVGLINFGTSVFTNDGENIEVFDSVTPSGTGLNPSQVGLGIAPIFGATPFNLITSFLSQLQAVVTNGQAKIVTDPTLVVQEGQTAAVQLTQEVVTNITIDRETTDAGILTTTTFQKEDAGLNLQVQIDRIDDNGFVNLAVAPSISAPTGVFQVGDTGTATLLSERQLTSGQVRVRDGQTLVLSGIIQESDRTTSTKVPILGDIPLLGALFRSTNRDTDRRELIVLLTPQIIDDSDSSVYGYSYEPGEDVQELLDNRNRPEAE